MSAYACGNRAGILFAIGWWLYASPVRAQDTRSVSEPVFPVVCKTVAAPLQLNAGSLLAANDTDAESTAETATISTAFRGCAAGQAVELSVGTGTNGFLINPLVVPAGVSLIVDGGVTVFASRDPAMYQVAGSKQTCGVSAASGGGCQALLQFSDNSGLYGYGVVDARGYAPMLTGSNAGQTWWYQTTSLPTGEYQNIPELLVADGSNFTLYKITLRNAPFYHVLWSNTAASPNGFTAWGIKIQSPWNVANTDGLDIWGTNASVINSTISEGDDDIAIDAWNNPTANVTIDNVTAYSRNGLSIGSGIVKGISNVLIENSNITGDIASLNGTTVNGVSEATMETQYGLTGYQQALPVGTTAIRGLNIKTRPQAGSVTNAIFANICIQDVTTALAVSPYMNNANGSVFPTLSGIEFKNIHVLAPETSPGYQLLFQAYAGGPLNPLTFDNVVFDDIANGASSLTSITADYNQFTTSTNVYPATLNQLASSATSVDGTKLYLSGNAYTAATTNNSATGAYACPSNAFPFIVGELYLTSAEVTNLHAAGVTSGSTVTLDAMVQPAMSQITYFAAHAYGKTPGLLAVGSPALTQPIQFYDGTTSVGEAALSANGTLATLAVGNLTAGTHTYTAAYPGDMYYARLAFGSATVTVAKSAPTVTVTPASANINATQTLPVTVAVAGAGTLTPTGSITLTSGSYTSAATPLASGGAQIDVPAGALVVGSDTLTVTYSGDNNYNGAAGTAAVNVTGAPGITLTGTNVSLTAGAVSGNDATITVTPTNGFSGTVTLTAVITAGPAGATNPPGLSFAADGSIAVSGGAPVTTILTVTTVAGVAARNLSGETRGTSYVALLPPGGLLIFCGVPMGRRRRRAWRFLASIVVVVCVASCGGGSGGSGGGGGGGTSGTTAGTYTVHVTGTAGSVSNAVDITVTVH